MAAKLKEITYTLSSLYGFALIEVIIIPTFLHYNEVNYPFRLERVEIVLASVLHRASKVIIFDSAVCLVDSISSWLSFIT